MKNIDLLGRNLQSTLEISPDFQTYEVKTFPALWVMILVLQRAFTYEKIKSYTINYVHFYFYGFESVVYN